MIDRLHYISQSSSELSHLEAIEQVLNAGGKWIQLRVKDQTEPEVLNLAKAANELCKKFAARLVINDFPDVSKAVFAHGLHLGLNDMNIIKARLITGNKIMIGGTANTFADIQKRVAEGADYIGLGPYRFTDTKQNLSPILGLKGYAEIMEQVKKSGIHLPIIAIGGITPEDLPELLKTGLYGVAVSGALTGKSDARERIKSMYAELEKHPVYHTLNP
ncbi:thiamine-phosphate pyrophosphorylase [Pedobacter steynii]|uniref:Thiamine-phosphate synthase n=1 Tax=Pedobacter steynii TaxID=430522 RepID=A0A1H0B9W4_9SPHI|nr:thiamine phosphate synthase [Pedobacter steynii]NQX41115.1 thiamine phosphate synthase [Pedobacter steynii]SDN42409.1 thiamine-phosphate pyrophosphorylase [Pedobacter steynii]